MTTWNELSNEEKLAHNALAFQALSECKALHAEVKSDSVWIGKNGPSAAPFGRETVENRAASVTAEKFFIASEKYEALLAKYRDSANTVSDSGN